LVEELHECNSVADSHRCRLISIESDIPSLQVKAETTEALCWQELNFRESQKAEMKNGVVDRKRQNVDLTLRELQESFNNMLVRLDKVEEGSDRGIEGFKSEIADFELSLRTLDMRLTTRLEEFTEDVSNLQSQTNSQQALLAKAKGNLQRLHVNVDSLKASLMGSDDRLDEVCESLAVTVNSFQELQEKQMKLEEWQSGLEDLLDEVENLRAQHNYITAPAAIDVSS